MKITRKETFKPVTIVLETEKEVAELYLALHKIRNTDRSARTIRDSMYSRGWMDTLLANDLVGKTNG